MKPANALPKPISLRHVGFFGCWRLDRVVRVGLETDQDSPIDRRPRVSLKGPQRTAVEISCPCGETHKVGNLMWRELGEDEEIDAEVWIVAES